MYSNMSSFLSVCNGYRFIDDNIIQKMGLSVNLIKLSKPILRVILEPVLAICTNEKFAIFKIQERTSYTMAFDGITIANIVHELRETLLDGRINKIAQPEEDELLLAIKTPSGMKRLYISASASLPLIYLTDTNKPSPMVAPNFCMLLRKHINNGRITDVTGARLFYSGNSRKTESFECELC